MRLARFVLVPLVLSTTVTLVTACRKTRPVPAVFKVPDWPIAKAAPPELLPGPQFDLRLNGILAHLPQSELVFPPAPLPKPQPKRAVRRPATPSTPGRAEPEDTLEDIEKAPIPQLGEVLTAEQQRQHREAIQQSIDRTQRMLAGVRRRRMDARQADAMRQIEEFVRQADSAVKTDLLLARTLAERAEILARDLTKSFR